MTSTPGAVPADRTSRVLGGVALALISAGVLMIAVLHLVGPTAEISVVRRTISEYQLTTSAWAFNLGVVLLAVGSLVVIVALVRDRVAGPGGVILLLGWVAGLLTLAMYEKHNWATGPSGTGQVHRLASLVAFLCLPLSMMVISARGRRTAAAGGVEVGVRARRDRAGLVPADRRGHAAPAGYRPALVAGHSSGSWSVVSRCRRWRPWSC